MDAVISWKREGGRLSLSALDDVIVEGAGLFLEINRFVDSVDCFLADAIGHFVMNRHHRGLEGSALLQESGR